MKRLFSSERFNKLFLGSFHYPGPSHLICFGQERAIRGVYIFQCETGILGVHDHPGAGLLFH